MSFFELVSFFVGFSDVVVSQFVDEELGGVGIVREKLVVSVELVGHSSFLN